MVLKKQTDTSANGPCFHRPRVKRTAAADSLGLLRLVLCISLFPQYLNAGCLQQKRNAVAYARCHVIRLSQSLLHTATLSRLGDYDGPLVSKHIDAPGAGCSRTRPLCNGTIAAEVRLIAGLCRCRRRFPIWLEFDETDSVCGLHTS